jgi:hypothetical protein
LGPPRVRRDLFKNDGIESIGHLSRGLSGTFSEPSEKVTSEKKNFVFFEKIIEKNPQKTHFLSDDPTSERSIFGFLVLVKKPYKKPYKKGIEFYPL